MAPTYLETIDAFTDFLTAYTHTLLYVRTLYPKTSFVNTRFHNASVYQSRHPLVCEWVRDAVAAVREELLLGTVSRIGIVVFSYGGEETGSVKIMERYMIDVSTFPVVDKYERNVEMQWAEEASDRDDEDSSEQGDEDEDENKEGEDKNEDDEGKNDEDEDNDDSEEGPEEDEQTASQQKEKEKEKEKLKELDVHVHVDLSEQFRAALLALSIRSSQLAPLPPNCSFNISLELKDEPDIDPPVRHPQPWIPVQPSLQKTGRKATVRDEDDEKKVEEGRKEGQDLGGVKFTPIRSVEIGVFRFETWVEEGKAKFEGGNKKTSVASSVEKA
jgi:mitotic spindle assembly checkpoint protein MAD2B